MFYRYQELEMHYKIYGHGTPILMIHGLSCDMRLMVGCMKPIFKDINGFQRIYIDLPGMGLSNAPLSFASCDKILEALLAFIEDNIKGNFILAGESYGGYLVNGIISVMPERVIKAIEICPMVVENHDERRKASKNFTDFDEEFMATLSERNRKYFSNFAVIANKETFDRYASDFIPGIKCLDKNFIYMLRKNYCFSFDLYARLAELKFNKPVLIFAGKQDTAVGYVDLYDGLVPLFPQASFILLNKAGHNLQIEQKDVFETIIKNWL